MKNFVFRSILLPLKFRIFQKKNAFTLAEVLITLGIIGVVAAITIPLLMSKIQILVLKQQYKKTLSTINQALIQSYYNNDLIYSCYYFEGGGVEKSECNQFFKEFKKNLRISHTCENNARKNGCIPEYVGIDTVIKHEKPDLSDKEIEEMTGGCRGYRKSSIDKQNPVWVLQDGTIIGLFWFDLWPIFYVDVNGKKGPNKWGFDVFSMDIYGDGSKLYAIGAGSCQPYQGGVKGSKMLQ